MRIDVAPWLGVALAPWLMAAIELPPSRAVQAEARLGVLGGQVAKVDESIASTKQLILRSADSSHLPELYFRLAELHVERSRLLYARLAEKSTGKVFATGEAALDVKLAKEQAIEIYDKLLSDYSGFKRIAQVRFFRAHEFRELGQPDKMIEGYRTLIAKHRNTSWAAQARLILAEHALEKGDVKIAERYCQEVLSMPPAASQSAQGMARVKLAMIRIQQQRFAAALSLLNAVVRQEDARSPEAAIPDDTRRQALEAMVWPFSEVMKARDAPRFFRKVAGSRAAYLDVLERLANRYWIKTSYADAASTYRELLNWSTDVEKNIGYLERLVEAMTHMPVTDAQRYAKAAEVVEAIGSTLARAKTHWRYRQADRSELEKNLELLARDLATRLHVVAKQKKDAVSTAEAASAYSAYLDVFNVPELRHGLEIDRAEALYQSRRYVDAGRAYEAASARARGDEQQSLIYSAILSFYQAVDSDAAYRAKHSNEEGELDPWELLLAREGLKQLGSYYVAHWPESPNAVAVSFNIARMRYLQGDYVGAASLFVDFVRDHPRHKDAAIAGDLALDALNQLERYEDLESLGTRFADNEDIPDAAFRQRARQVAQAAKQRRMQLALSTANAQEFGAKMLAEFDKSAGSRAGEEALYAAFVKLKTDNDAKGVLDFARRLQDAYPQSSHLPEVLTTTGWFQLRAADFAGAASTFEDFSQAYGAQDDAVTMLQQAAMIREQLGQYERALADLDAIRSSGAGEARAQAEMAALSLRDRLGQGADLEAAALNVAQGNPQSLAAAFYLGLAYVRQGKIDEARRAFARAATLAPASGPMSDDERALAARALFEQGQLLQRELDVSGQVEAREAEQQLGRRLEVLRSLEEIYVDTINAGQGTWAVAALHETARAYQGLGDFVRGLPLPEELAPSAHEDYRAALDRQAEAYGDRAQETLRACSEKAQDLRVFSSYARNCLRGDIRVVGPDRRDLGSEADAAPRRDDTFERLRNQLWESPGNPVLLVAMARAALRANNPRLAKLTVLTLLETNASASAQNLLGIAEWLLGDPQAADDAFRVAGDNAATNANLAALYRDFGHEQWFKQHRAQLRSRPVPADADLHPRARELVDEVLDD